MNFEFNEQEKMAFTSVKKAVEKCRFSDLTWQDLKALEPGSLVRSLASNLSQTGFLSLCLEKEKKKDLVFLAACQEKLAQCCPELYLSLEMGNRLFAQAIKSFGNTEQQERFLPKLYAGELLGAMAFLEENMNFQENLIKTKAMLYGDNYRILGQKNLVMNIAFADWIAVLAEIEGKLGLFLVNQKSEGLKIETKEGLYSWPACLSGKVEFLDTPVLKENVLIPSEDKVLSQKLALWEEFILTSYSLGLAKSAFKQALSFAKTHESAGKQILTYQEVSFKLAEMTTLIQTAELLALRAAWGLQNKERDAGTKLHCAKVFCAESAEQVASQARQVLSTEGLQKGCPAERAHEIAKYCQIAGFSTEVCRVRIGDAVLKSKQ